MHNLFTNFEVKKRGLRVALFFTIVSLICFLIENTILQFILLGLGLISFVFTLVQPEAFYSFTNCALEFVLVFLSGIVKVGLLLIYLIIFKPIRFVIDLFPGKKKS
ncbi:hypothetical protein [Leptospira mayottensis]|uniref:Uncharacterized protein n=2 Tax=Leptospira mayottensis TaxID=1137606 RepID=A0AA87MSM1_9LEPT|nr:hypothetical protein [Leptospira mayottensis]AXR61215.1 hypothetical protein DQM68_11540 [Leptospira mayottensis]AXR65530.1 hypothetical protein DQM28_16205 [Leptospira mayottensis]AXR68782.1 hypothetical protein DPV73_12990 [Leptospira mayottensis]AZQ02348.1 hypothetical protein LEP1GSC190_10170 [Leptospira mayottensis 200901116]EKS01051.1 hypothetical protein LEP1GSC125_2031 [Leptospira mayottensis 200901122]